MANVSGKAYGLTAITRMHPLKTYGLRVVFGGIELSLLPPGRRGVIVMAVAGPLLVAAVDGLVRVLVWRGLMASAWPVFWSIGRTFGLDRPLATLAGIAVVAVLSAILGAVIGPRWQPKWTILGRIGQIQENLINLSFIHFARWVIIKKGQFPRLASTQPKETLHYDYLMFESNFNGDWEKYIDAFSVVVPGGMDNIWRWSVRYPNSKPITPFLDYIRNCQYDTDHYYSAYPGAATNDVLGALKLHKEMAALVTQTANASPEEFAMAFEHFKITVQNCLSTTGSPPFPPRLPSRGVRVPAGASVPMGSAVAPTSASA